jgi:hypothetical protein
VTRRFDFDQLSPLCRYELLLSTILPQPKDVKEKREKLKPGERLTISLLGCPVDVVRTHDGIRALSKGMADTPASVEGYLVSKFGEHLDAAHRAIIVLARSFTPADLAPKAFRLYEHFRRALPAGEAVYGAAVENRRAAREPTA